MRHSKLMKQISKKLSVILLSSAIIFSQNAFAARLGKQRSLGMQRSTSSYKSNGTTNNTNNNAGYSQPGYAGQSNTQQQQQRGPGVGAVVAGAAAGAVGGYMLGKAMNSSDKAAIDKANSSQVAQGVDQRQTINENHIPWGIITILGLLLVIGLMIFRRKTMPQVSSNSTNNMAGMENNSFEIPNIRRENTAYTQGNTAQQPQQPVVATPEVIAKVADGVETQYFLRQAKGMFLHIQSMNTPENVSEIAKYMTPELYAEIKNIISENDYVADFSQLDCNLIDTATENGNYIASVRFFGLVSDSPNSPQVKFSEIWHFVKPVGADSAKWLVAGIQQETIN